MPNLGLELAQKAVQKALELSRTEYGNRPLSVAVCDKNGFLMAFAKMDDAKLLTIELTQRKAYTASRLGGTTRAFQERLQKENLDISWFGDGLFTALPGGVPVIDAEKRLLGAVGIGGISAREDHEAAEKVVASLQA